MMPHWKRWAKGLKDVSNHPWYGLLDDQIALVAEKQRAKLENRGELDAYLTVRVTGAIEEFERYIANGDDPNQAEATALRNMLPVAEEDLPKLEEFETEEFQEGLMAAFQRFYAK